MVDAQNRFAAHLTNRDIRHSKRERLRAQDTWKRNLAGRGNGTIDPWYGCDVYDEMLDYAVNFTFPWCTVVSPLHVQRLLTLQEQR